jgi:hypothetical protein
MKPGQDISKLFDEFVQYRIGQMPGSEQDVIKFESLKDKSAIFLTPVGSQSVYGLVGKDEFPSLQAKMSQENYQPQNGQSFFSFVNDYGSHWNLIKYVWNQDENQWDKVDINCKGDGACGVHAMVNAVLSDENLKQNPILQEASTDSGLDLTQTSSNSLGAAIDFVISAINQSGTDHATKDNFVKKMNLLKATNGSNQDYWADAGDIEIFAQTIGVVVCNKNQFTNQDEARQLFIDRRQTILENLAGQHNTNIHNYTVEEIAKLEEFLATRNIQEADIEEDVKNILKLAKEQEISQATNISNPVSEGEDITSIIKFLTQKIVQEKDESEKEYLQIQLALLQSQQSFNQEIAKQTSISDILKSLEKNKNQQKKQNIIFFCEALGLEKAGSKSPCFVFEDQDSENTIFIPSQLDKFTINDTSYLNDLYQKLAKSLGQMMGDDNIEIDEPTTPENRKRARSNSDSSKSDDNLKTPLAKRPRFGQSSATHLTPGGTTKLRDTRGRTEVGPQVEHASAYALFEELIISSLEGQKISDVPNILHNILGCLPISEAAMNTIKEEAMRERLIVTDEDRKKATRSVRGTNYLVKHNDTLKSLIAKMDDVDKKIELERGLERIEEIDPLTIKSAIKSSNILHMSGAVAKIIDICLNGTNKMKYASMSNEGVPENPNTGNEKAAKDNLRLLSDFLEDIADIQSSSERDKQLKQSEISQDKKRITLLGEKWGIDKQTIDNLIDGKAKVDDVFKKVKSQISNHMGQLFYYPRLDPENLHEYKIDGIPGKWAVSKEEWNEVMAQDEKSKQEGKKPKYNKGTKPRNNDPEIMYELTGRHIILCFNCFRGLSRFDKRNQQIITENFLQNCVLDGQGWVEEIHLESLQDEIGSYAEINYSGREFFAKNSQRGREHSASQDTGMLR